MSQQAHIAIVILAAGASTRMGRPKQLLQWGNTSLIKHVLTIAKSTNLPDIFVVLGANSAGIKAHLGDISASIITNELWHEGLGQSIAFAVKHLLHSHKTFKAALFLLGDQPFVTKTHLDKMLMTYNSNDEKIIATQYTKEKIGVPALFDAHYFSELSGLQGDKGANLVLKKYAPKVDRVIPDFKTIDIDTIEDYNKVLSIYQGKNNV